MILDIYKHGEVERHLDLFDPSSRTVSKISDLPETVLVTQFGPILVVTKAAKGGPIDWESDNGGRVYWNVTCEAREARTDAPLWTRAFPKQAPRIWATEASGNLVFAWRARSDAARDIAKNDHFLQGQMPPLGPTSLHLIEILGARTGIVAGRLFVDLGDPWRMIHQAAAAGDAVLIDDGLRRVRIYSLSKRERIGQVFGVLRAVDKSGTRFAASSRFTLKVYNAATLREDRELQFPTPVIYAAFQQDGGNLLVVTSDQRAYTVALTTGRD